MPATAPPGRNRRPGSPVRPMLALAAVIAILAGAVAFGRAWTPRLGLDLSGGTSLVLQARALDGSQPTNASMVQAQSIIRNRVNANGVAESSVALQGRNQVVVQAPNTTQAQLRRLVGTTAEVNFRQVLGVAPVAAPAPAPSLTLTTTPTPAPATSAPATTAPTAPATTAPTAPATTAPTAPAPPAATPSISPAAYHLASPAARVGSRGLSAGVGSVLRAASAAPSPGSAPAGAVGPGTVATPAPSAAAVAPAATAPAVTVSGSAAPVSTAPAPASTAVPSLGPGTPIAGVLKATISPAVPQALLARFDAFTCSDRAEGSAAPAGQYLITCDTGNSVKYLLAPAFIQGTDVATASAALPQNGVGGWQVNVQVKGGRPTDLLREATTALVALPQDTSTQPGQSSSNFAIVLDGVVQSAPYVQGAITGGSAQISGTFTQQSSQALAQVVKFGALPVSFDVLTAQTTSPSLGGEQLKWGLIAGGIGLVLVVAFAVLYYRALAVAVTGSLAVAAITSYLLVVFLGARIGYALSLPGIAGFIVSIGITADSFVVYFERLRDEIREGRPLRTAVETGWARARRTIVSADFVSLLAAVVLYLLAIQDVRGFAFTLGLTTLVDILVVFLFTKPLVSLLVRTRFFGEGHRFSGLDPEHIGRQLTRPRLGDRPAAAGVSGTGGAAGPAGAAGAGGAAGGPGEPVPVGGGGGDTLDPVEAARARARARAGARAGAGAGIGGGTANRSATAPDSTGKG